MAQFSRSDLEAVKPRLSTSDQGATWHAASFATLDDAVYFVNLPPAQGAGEFVFSDNSYGGVDVAYYL